MLTLSLVHGFVKSLMHLLVFTESSCVAASIKSGSLCLLLESISPGCTWSWEKTCKSRWPVSCSPSLVYVWRFCNSVNNFKLYFQDIMADHYLWKGVGNMMALFLSHIHPIKHDHQPTTICAISIYTICVMLPKSVFKAFVFDKLYYFIIDQMKYIWPDKYFAVGVVAEWSKVLIAVHWPLMVWATLALGTYQLRFVSWVFHVIFHLYISSHFTLWVACLPLVSPYHIICIYSIFGLQIIYQ